MLLRSRPSLGRAASNVIAGNDVRNRRAERYGRGEGGGTAVADGRG